MACDLANCEHGRRQATAVRPPIDTPRWPDNNNLYTRIMPLDCTHKVETAYCQSRIMTTRRPLTNHNQAERQSARYANPTFAPLACLPFVSAFLSSFCADRTIGQSIAVESYIYKNMFKHLSLFQLLFLRSEN